MVKVAINGFGRIGRMVLRCGMAHSDIEFVAINDLGDLDTMAHLLKHDSVHGKFDGTVEVKDGSLIVNGNEVKMFSERDPAELPWGDLGVDVVFESTGVFRTKEDCQKHIDAGAKKVLMSAPPKDDIQMCVKGINDDKICEGNIISNASCTTNSLAPVAMVLDREFGVESALMTTVHSYTNDQQILDLPHKDLRRARAAGINIIPTSTGAAKAVGKVIPELDGKLDGMAMRVPTADGSITDFAVLLKKEATAEEINAAIKKACEKELKGVLEYSEEDLVSTDIIGNHHSGIFDSKLTKSMGKLAKVCIWYDNEMGYSQRMIDVLKEMAKR